MKQNKAKRVSRRFFLKVAAALAVVIGFLAVIGRVHVWPRRREIYRAVVRPSAKESYGNLTTEEFEYILALGTILYPVSNDDEEGEIREVIREWSVVRTGVDGALGKYREGIASLAWATREAGREEPFYALPPQERLEVLGLIDPPSDNRPRGSDASPAQQVRYPFGRLLDYRTFRRRIFLSDLRDELISGIYSSHLGWALVGYETWPGVSGDPAGHSLPPPAFARR